MRILILGADGYLGFPLMLHFLEQGHTVAGLDDETRRRNVADVGSNSAIRIATLPERIELAEEYFQQKLVFFRMDLCKPRMAKTALSAFRPDTIIHLAEQPSAPHSMISEHKCWYTMYNNIRGTLNVLYAMKKYTPEAHLIKLGTMGEHGVSGKLIKETAEFIKRPMSWYHATKCHDSINIELASKIWDITCTDIMQGIVYGTRTEIMRCHTAFYTRFDYDQYFGTVINRFCAQAVIDHPLTVYGHGGQKRSFLPLPDVMRCIQLLAESRPVQGQYRVVNQFHEMTSIMNLAKKVVKAGHYCNLDVKIQELPNPRVEEEDHYYEVEKSVLTGLGYKSEYDMDQVIEDMLLDLLSYKDRIKPEVIAPTTDWREIT